MKKIIQTFAAAILISCIPAAIISAQAPANDDCGSAIAISTTAFGVACATNIFATTVNATASTPATSCGGIANDDDIWYSFTANSASVIVRVSNALSLPTGSANMAMEVYGGSCGTLTSLFCVNVFAFGNGYQIVNGLSAGNNYYVRLWTTSTTNDANFNFCIQDVPAAANDECSVAIPITVQPGGSSCASTVSANTTGATKSIPDISGCTLGSNDDDIWYSFTASMPSLTLRFNNALLTTTNTPGNLGYAVYSSACPSGTIPFACLDYIAFGTGSTTINGLTTGNTYFLKLFSAGDNNYMSFDFCLQQSSVLPVYLASFLVLCNNGKNTIWWLTTSEVKNNFFTLERSSDGLHFETLAVVNAAVNSGTENKYSVTDLHPFDNKTFYRLKQTDLEGREHYFKILAADCGNNNSNVRLYPNPVSNKLFIELNNKFKRIKVKILSVSGNVLNTTEFNTPQANNITINTQQYFPGIYLLELTDEKDKQHIFKFVKR